MQYTYLIGSLITLSGWIVLFILRKNVRREMLFVSVFFSMIGLLLEGLVWVKDWWNPEIMTGTIIGIEDLIFGFALGGVAAVIYEEVFKRKIYERKKQKHNLTHFILLITAFPIITLLLFFGLQWHSFPATTAGLFIPTVVMLYKRKDLVPDAVATGIILTVLVPLGFFLLNLADPGFVHQWWFLDKLSGIIFLGAPIEDLVWFFCTGLFLGPIYEFWQNARLVNA
jgi:hypothetical protein